MSFSIRYKTLNRRFKLFAIASTSIDIHYCIQLSLAQLYKKKLFRTFTTSHTMITSSMFTFNFRVPRRICTNGMSIAFWYNFRIYISFFCIPFRAVPSKWSVKYEPHTHTHAHEYVLWCCDVILCTVLTIVKHKFKWFWRSANPVIVLNIRFRPH